MTYPDPAANPRSRTVAGASLLRCVTATSGSFLVPLLFLACLAPAFTVFADRIDNDPVMHSGYGRELMLRGEYEKGLEQLRRAYMLFPLNLTFKRNLAEGYAAYGHRFFKQKQYEQADENYVKAMELYPEEMSYALLRGISSYHLKRYDVARYELERARLKMPDSPEVLYYLGLVLYETDSRPMAVELWEQGLKVAPGRGEFAGILERSRREMAVEANMDRGHSSRFDLTYDPGVDTVFALAILDVLERAASLVGAELGHFPQARVPVAIYKRDDFKAVTDSPDWSGGVYDGTIRLPFGALHEITPPMLGVLYHEYAHVVVFDLTRGNCPLWLNEGVAEMFARMQHNRPMAELGRAVRKDALLDFRRLESDFNGLSVADINLAYQQGYALVNYLVTTYGWHRVTALMSALGRGMGIDAAIAESFKDYGLTYDGVVREWKSSMARGINGK